MNASKLTILFLLSSCAAETIVDAPPPPPEVMPVDPKLPGPTDRAPLPEPTPFSGAVAQLGASRPLPLEVEFLGVGGFIVRHGNEAVMTNPMFTRQSLVSVTAGAELHSDIALVTSLLPRAKLAGVRAIVVGHAHYDHLMDGPAAQLNADKPFIYGNQSLKNLFAALQPQPPAGCPAGSPPSVVIEPERVVAVDNPADSRVDYRLCPLQKPAGAPLEGRWTRVPGSNIRVMAVCSEHPDQFGPVHFAPGGIDAPQCQLPSRADAWKEGNTISWLVDFLDPFTAAPVARFYYQDSPGNDPIGYVPPELLAEKRIDIALLCVGNYNTVPNEPTRTLQAMTPRFALGGHWEDFFRPYDQPTVGLPFTDIAEWARRAKAALPSTGSDLLVHNGALITDRALLPQPRDTFVVPPAR